MVYIYKTCYKYIMNNKILRKLEQICEQKTNHESDYVISESEPLYDGCLTHYILSKITNNDYNNIGFFLDDAYLITHILPKGSYLYHLDTSDTCDIKNDWNEVMQDLFSNI